MKIFPLIWCGSVSFWVGIKNYEKDDIASIIGSMILIFLGITSLILSFCFVTGRYIND